MVPHDNHAMLAMSDFAVVSSSSYVWATPQVVGGILYILFHHDTFELNRHTMYTAVIIHILHELSTGITNLK